ncbi:hypothetical protein [Shewanella chilikensis]|uniref:hypothetical protein n=1 Tax=Shewanella chilikensis TaxID=558541 RepID=UPI003007DC72
MSKHLVLSVKPYDFQNNQGERVTGAKVTYINKKPSSREGEYGYPPLIVSVSNMNLVSNLKEVPAVYEMDFEQVTGKNNKPEIILTDVELISPVDMAQIF